VNIEAYIESGVLESYVMGLCDEAEQMDVERLCKMYPELETKLDRIQADLALYAQSHAKKAPAHIKQAIFDEIDLLEKPVAKIKIHGKNEVYQEEEKPSVFNNKWLIAASVTMFVLSSITNVILYSKWKDANQQMIALNAEKSLLAENTKSNQIKMDLIKNEMQIISSPEVSKVMMKGMEKSPESMAMVYWNKNTREVFVEVKKLPPPAEGMQYQLWAIVDGKPMDAGMLPMEPTDSSLIKMKDFGEAEAFAITLEKMGGSPSPTMTEMLVMGGI